MRFGLRHHHLSSLGTAAATTKTGFRVCVQVSAPDPIAQMGHCPRPDCPVRTVCTSQQNLSDLSVTLAHLSVRVLVLFNLFKLTKNPFTTMLRVAIVKPLICCVLG